MKPQFTFTIPADAGSVDWTYFLFVAMCELIIVVHCLRSLATEVLEMEGGINEYSSGLRREAIEWVS